MQEAWKPRIEPKDKPPSPDRRMFLQALGGLAASAALAHESIKLAGIMLEQAMHTEESLPLRERILDGVVQIIEQSMRSPQMRDAFNGKGKDPLALILNAARYPILPKHLDGTSYDVEPLTKKYQVQLGMLVDQGNHGQPPSNRISMRADPEAHERDNFLSVHDAGYGNGAYWDDMHLILTASHVLAMYFPEKKELSTEVIDIGLLRVPKKFAAHGKSEVIHDAGKLTDSDIHGSFAAISGTDYETHGRTHTKIRPKYRSIDESCR
jgi:hypothetical protein